MAALSDMQPLRADKTVKHKPDQELKRELQVVGWPVINKE